MKGRGGHHWESNSRSLLYQVENDISAPNIPSSSSFSFFLFFFPCQLVVRKEPLRLHFFGVSKMMSLIKSDSARPMSSCMVCGSRRPWKGSFPIQSSISPWVDWRILSGKSHLYFSRHVLEKTIHGHCLNQIGRSDPARLIWFRSTRSARINKALTVTSNRSAGHGKKQKPTDAMEPTSHPTQGACLRIEILAPA